MFQLQSDLDSEEKSAVHQNQRLADIFQLVSLDLAVADTVLAVVLTHFLCKLALCWRFQVSPPVIGFETCDISSLATPWYI